MDILLYVVVGIIAILLCGVIFKLLRGVIRIALIIGIVAGAIYLIGEIGLFDIIAQWLPF